MRQTQRVAGSVQAVREALAATLYTLPPSIEFVGGRSWVQPALGVARLREIERERTQLCISDAPALCG